MDRDLNARRQATSVDSSEGRRWIRRIVSEGAPSTLRHYDERRGLPRLWQGGAEGGTGEPRPLAARSSLLCRAEGTNRTSSVEKTTLAMRSRGCPVRLTRRLGAGGMGAVYLARDLRLERDVAIKILTARSLGRLMGLKPEAWAMSTVMHPGVAQIHGVESWRGRPFLVVEFLAGGTLEDRLRDGPLAPSQAVSVAARLADALAALHEKGCLHGDVKPSNIGFTAEGSPKLLDFGLAHAVDDAAMVGGTLPYLSPEVLSGRPAGEADDVWSLSVVLYEMAAGRHPFAGGTLEAVQRRIRRQRLAAGGPAASAAPAAAAAVAAFAASVADGHPGEAAGNRARLRRGAGRGPRERLAANYSNLPVRFSPAIRLLEIIGKLEVDLCPKRTRSER